MSYLGIEFSTVTYNTIIDGYGKAELFEDMENVLTDMIESGDSLPDIFTFNSIIGAYGRGGQIEKMESTSLLNLTGKPARKAGKIEKMEKYFKEMKQKGMKPNAITYCSLVSAYSKAGSIKKVDSILRQVENSDVVLDTPCFNCIISAYSQAGNLKRMAELFLAMKGKKCMPDNVTFATIIQSYNAHGLLEAAQDLENKLINRSRNSGVVKELRGNVIGMIREIDSDGGIGKELYLVEKKNDYEMGIDEKAMVDELLTATKETGTNF
ncbi:Tetratricopeptide repeat-like superfamily protein isoform 2 [Hibiscus syriacus]|uniref:Tetratricopeptide repeat-like superfamily protein isoform 2 n=1 Tax=Hibiscus syriacus TaxID=106335 RepID=A0A6A2Y3W3_HIBSY|nr:Tetratricopeptide repeat-like superfamily protein isoform 2 [Hibiscus syriacus]